ncbi:DUF6573 family protein [Actinomadura sp. LOL_016]|uniref:DUF6573 family protein n=1 Tax=unclassified Actinomadura TaxID=2626254 RepID=UPI003A7FA0A1
MDTDRTPAEIIEMLGDPIDITTRADLLADGALIEAREDLARDARFRVPVALTRAAWTDCVEWTDEDTDRTGMPLDAAGRLYDVLWMAGLAMRAARPTGPARIPFRVARVDRDGLPGDDGIEPTEVPLTVELGTDHEGAPCVTIALRGED